MKKIDLMPTHENIIESIKNDTTGRNNYIYNFVKMLNTQSDSWSIAIDGKWGTGKTFFVKQCKLVIDYLNDEQIDDSEKEEILKTVDRGKRGCLSEIKYKTAYFDAWKNDSELDPIVALSESIASVNYNMSSIIEKKAKEAGKKLIKIAIKEIAKIDIKDILDLFDKKEDPEEKFKATLSSLIPDNERLVIFVDELDRCRPTYAVKLLERVQHFFDNEKITFVFSVNLFELRNTIKKFYGANFDGDRYLDRFFDVIIPIPDPDLKYYYQKLDSSPTETNSMLNKFCLNVAKEFNFSLRELNHFLSRTHTAVYNVLFSKDFNQSLWLTDRNCEVLLSTCVIPYLIALKMSDSKSFNSLINGKDGENFITFLGQNREFNRIISAPDPSEAKKAAKKIYEGIFIQNSNDEVIKISKNLNIEEPNNWRNFIFETISLVSKYSNYQDSY